MVGPAGRGRPPGGPTWAILSHGPPGGRALPEAAPGKKPQGFRLATHLSRHLFPRDLLAGKRLGCTEKRRCTPLEFHECKEQEGRQARPPPRGGWRGHEWNADAWQKTSGRGRVGGSTALGRRGKRDSAPMDESRILRMDPVDACIDGFPQYSPRRPFHLLRRHNPIGNPSTGRPPPEKGGECSRAPHALNTAPSSRPRRHHPQNSRRTPLDFIRKNFSNHWKTAENFFQSLEKPGHFFQPLEKSFPIIGKIRKGRAGAGQSNQPRLAE